MNGSENLKPLHNEEWEFTQAHFDQIAEIAQTHFGLELSNSKRSLIYSRLAKRMKALILHDFSHYLKRLHGPDGALERGELLSVLTTNITHFFREDHHFETLKADVLPNLIARAKAGQRVRLWSAGCSTGQEPYSIAMTILEMFPDAATYDFKILATDIDPIVVKKAESGIYSEGELDGLPPLFRQRYVAAARGDPENLAVDPGVQSLITFRVLNLIQPLPVSGPFDVIFCRNVTIYFDKATQGVVWGQLCSVLAEGAYLFIGHSERISGPLVSRMKKEGFTTFRKE